MKNDWEKAIDFVLKAEGGYGNNPNDPGGETKFGISKKSYPSLDIKNLTLEQAKKIYIDDYWVRCRCDDLSSPFAIATFDCAVNQGTTKAKRILQMALEVKVDGIIGPITIAAASKSIRYQVKKLLALRLSEYARLISENKRLLEFSVNWCYRVINLSELVLNEPNE
jgi:lysozyme family protein